jgi:hypothetical protein
MKRYKSSAAALAAAMAALAPIADAQIANNGFTVIGRPLQTGGFVNSNRFVLRPLGATLVQTSGSPLFFNYGGANWNNASANFNVGGPNFTGPALRGANGMTFASNVATFNNGGFSFNNGGILQTLQSNARASQIASARFATARFVSPTSPIVGTAIGGGPVARNIAFVPMGNGFSTPVLNTWQPRFTVIPGTGQIVPLDQLTAIGVRDLPPRRAITNQRVQVRGWQPLYTTIPGTNRKVPLDQPTSRFR